LHLTSFPHDALPISAAELFAAGPGDLIDASGRPAFLGDLGHLEQPQPAETLQLEVDLAAGDRKEVADRALAERGQLVTGRRSDRSEEHTSELQSRSE